METNRDLLDFLFETHQIDLRRGRLFDTDPSPAPGPVDWDRVEGMMLGLAIGDALGNTTESMTPSRRRAQIGEIRDYLPNWHAGSRRVGLPSDDTQLAFWTLEQMIADGGLNPDHVARRFCREPIFGTGHAVSAFRERCGACPGPAYLCGTKSAGNGAVMRIAPVLIPHLRTASAELWVDTALAAMITHNDSAAISACLAFVNILWQLLSMSCPPEPGWWPDTYLATAGDVETDEIYGPRGGDWMGYEGTLSRVVYTQTRWAYRRGLPARDACETWYSGAFLVESMPSALYILMRHSDDPEEAIVRAVNDTRDNDTIAALVGAAAGALHGRRGLPARWIDNLLGRTGPDDDGAVFHLLDAARRLWEPVP